MSYDDKRLITKGLAFTRSKEALAEIGYLKVHLNKEDHGNVMENYAVRELPTVLMLDPGGVEVKRHEGFMNDITFKNDFLEMKSLDATGDD